MHPAMAGPDPTPRDILPAAGNANHGRLWPSARRFHGAARPSRQEVFGGFGSRQEAEPARRRLHPWRRSAQRGSTHEFLQPSAPPARAGRFAPIGCIHGFWGQKNALRLLGVGRVIEGTALGVNRAVSWESQFSRDGSPCSRERYRVPDGEFLLCGLLAEE